MSKEDMIGILTGAMKPGVASVVINTKDYIYCLVAKDAEGSSWKEASITFPDGGVEQKDIPPGKALMLLIEELLRGLPNYVDNLPIAKNELEIQTAIERIKGL
ncbi:MAG: hypothetical protein HWN66_10290 [Candidatus Helarchaeota archaeon]|nr:hypothetical protein [Candidatus Helarchaeota archaeon]